MQMTQGKSGNAFTSFSLMPFVVIAKVFRPGNWPNCSTISTTSLRTRGSPESRGSEVKLRPQTGLQEHTSGEPNFVDASFDEQGR
jgi:hypothetical protein